MADIPPSTFRRDMDFGRNRVEPRRYGVWRYGVGRYSASDPTRFAWGRVKPAALALILSLFLAPPAAADTLTPGLSLIKISVDVEDPTRTWGSKEDENKDILDAAICDKRVGCTINGQLIVQTTIQAAAIIAESSVTVQAPLTGDGLIGTPIGVDSSSVTLLGPTIGAGEVDDDIATQAELDIVKVDVAVATNSLQLQINTLGLSTNSLQLVQDLIGVSTNTLQNVQDILGISTGTIQNVQDILGVSTDSLQNQVDALGTSAAGWTDDGTTVRLTTPSDVVGMGISNPSVDLEVSKSAGSPVAIAVTNRLFGNEFADAIFISSVASTNDGDPHSRYTVGGGAGEWNAGIHNSDGQKYKISRSRFENEFVITTTGDVGISTGIPQSKLDVNGTVTALEFAGGGSGLTSLDGANLVAASVTTAKIGDGAVTSVKIADDAVVAVKLAPDSVLESKILDNAVTTNKLGFDLVLTPFSLLIAAGDGDLRVEGVGGSTSLRLGQSAQANTPNCTAVGDSSNCGAGGTGGTAIGADSVASVTDDTAVGRGANAAGGNTVAIGGAASTTVGRGICVGDACASTGNNIGLGADIAISGAESLVIGRGSGDGGFGDVKLLAFDATASAANQFIGGANGNNTTAVFFGNGTSDASPVSYSIFGTSGSGVNVVGGSITMGPGAGTGSGGSGFFRVMTATGGLEGSSVSNALIERFRIDNFGNIGIGESAPSEILDVAGNIRIQSGTPPSTSGTDAVVLYSTDTATASAELIVLSEDGDRTVLSTHNFDHFTPDASCPSPWSFKSDNSYTGKGVAVDLCKLAMKVEALTGEKILYPYEVPKRSWANDEADKVAKRVSEITAWDLKEQSLFDERQAEIAVGKEQEPYMVLPHPKGLYTPRAVPQRLYDRGAR